jgi:hypothetical protein
MIVPQETRGTPVGDYAQESQGNELQVEEKVAIFALENLKLYVSDSQSSNDLIGCEVSAHPTTAESRTLALPGRGCLKQTEDWSSVHAIRKVTTYCPAIDMSDARTIHAKLTDAPSKDLLHLLFILKRHLLQRNQCPGQPTQWSI